MDIISRLQWRYATKKFDPKRSLSAKKLEILTQAFNLTATSYGLQPLKMLVIENKELQEELVAASYNQRQVADASHLLVICIERNVKAPYVKDYFERVKEIRDTPEKILAPFRETLEDKFENQEQGETREWAIRQAYLAMGNLLTVCALEEIDACPMEGIDPSQYDELLSLKEKGLETVLVLPVGYRAEDDMFAGFKKVRRPVEETVIYR